MKGIVLAGGTGSRLMPLTKATNKHLLPVGEKPMIFHPIEKLTAAGINDIMIVTGTEHMGAVVQCLGSGKDFGASITYRVQDESGGIAQALGLCRGFCYGERMCVILGDNMFKDDLFQYAQQYQEQDRGARVILAKVPDLTRFGVAFVNGSGKILDVIEKPSEEEIADRRDQKMKGMAVTGIYFYDQRVFEVIDSLKPSGRGELEITDVNKAYLEWGELYYSEFRGRWTDAGTHKSLLEANKIMS